MPPKFQNDEENIQKDMSIWNINIVLGWGKMNGRDQPFYEFGFTVGNTKMISDTQLILTCLDDVGLILPLV
jgi:hypothetical protein